MYDLKPDSTTIWDGTYEFTSYNTIYKNNDMIDNINKPGEILTVKKVAGPAINAYEYTLTNTGSPVPTKSVAMAFTDCKGKNILKLVSLDVTLDLVAKQNQQNTPLKGKFTSTVQYKSLNLTALIYGTFVRK